MTKFCPSCGAELIDGAKFCRNCGVSIENKSQTVNNSFERPVVQKDHTLAIVLGYVLAFFFPILGAICGIYLATRKDSRKAKIHGIIVIIIAILIQGFSFMFLRYV